MLVRAAVSVADQDVIDRHNAKVHTDPAQSCHHWIGALHHGPDARDQAPVMAHTCDEASCQNPAHLVLSSNAGNHDDWLRRRWSIGSPLRDTRGPAGRAQAVREAIITGASVQVAKQAGASDLDRAQLPLWGEQLDDELLDLDEERARA